MVPLPVLLLNVCVSRGGAEIFVTSRATATMAGVRAVIRLMGVVNAGWGGEDRNAIGVQRT